MDKERTGSDGVHSSSREVTIQEILQITKWFPVMLLHKRSIPLCERAFHQVQQQVVKNGSISIPNAA